MVNNKRNLDHLNLLSTGDGEGIKGYKDGGPPTLCKPASQQGGREEVNSLAGGAWRGLEECWGFWVNFCKGELLFEIVKFLSLVRCGLAGSPMNQFSAELNGRREFQMKRESFI